MKKTLIVCSIAIALLATSTASMANHGRGLGHHGFRGHHGYNHGHYRGHHHGHYWRGHVGAAVGAGIVLGLLAAPVAARGYYYDAPAYYAPPVYYSPPSYYYPPVVEVPVSAPAYVERAPRYFSYYCQSTRSYQGPSKTCPEGWQKVYVE